FLPIFLVVPILVCLVSFGFASRDDGSEFLRQCNAAVRQMDGETLSAADQVDAIYCMGYLSGFIDSHTAEIGARRALQETTDQAKEIYCLPKAIEVGQLVRIVTKYLKENPKILNKRANVCVVYALVSEFPCSP